MPSILKVKIYVNIMMGNYGIWARALKKVMMYRVYLDTKPCLAKAHLLQGCYYSISNYAYWAGAGCLCINIMCF
jgi:hypothetical protein